MSSNATPGSWRFVYFGLIVTGQGEERFLGQLLRSLTASGHCQFQIVARIGQLSPRSGARHGLRVVGTTKNLPQRDEELGLHARSFIKGRQDRFVLVIDDLEGARRAIRESVFARYRQALDALLGADSWRAGAFFLVNMLEAYYFADAAAVNAVLGTSLQDHLTDVEDIGHPKGELKRLNIGFDEVEHGEAIVGRLDVMKVLSRPDECAGLRSLFAWCTKATGEPRTNRYQLANGALEPVTSTQLSSLDGRI